MKRAKHAHGSSAGVDTALQSGVINAFDVLFLDADTDNPKIGWVSKDGKKKIINETLDADLDALESELATKATKTEVEKQIDSAVVDVIGITNAYTDSQIETKIQEVVSGFEVIEF